MGIVSIFNFTTDTEQVTRTKLNNLVTNLVNEFNGNVENDNIKAAAGIVDSKLAQLTTADKVSGSTLTGLIFYENALVSYENTLVFVS